MTVTVDQLRNLTDRADRGRLTTAEVALLRAGIDQMACDLDARPAATEAAASPLRDLIAAALYERERPPNDPHWPDAYPMDREVFEPMADAVLAALVPHLNIGEDHAVVRGRA